MNCCGGQGLIESVVQAVDLRAAQGSQRAIGIQGTLSAEEAYVESVAQRYWRMYGGR